MLNFIKTFNSGAGSCMTNRVSMIYSTPLAGCVRARCLQATLVSLVVAAFAHVHLFEEHSIHQGATSWVFDHNCTLYLVKQYNCS